MRSVELEGQMLAEMRAQSAQRVDIAELARDGSFWIHNDLAWQSLFAGVFRHRRDRFEDQTVLRLG
jgi:hypothetical protein